MKKSFFKSFSLCLIGASFLAGSLSVHAQEVTKKNVNCNLTVLSATNPKFFKNFGDLRTTIKNNKDDVFLRDAKVCTLFFSKGEPSRFIFKDVKTGRTHVYVKPNMNVHWTKSR